MNERLGVKIKSAVERAALHGDTVELLRLLDDDLGWSADLAPHVATAITAMPKHRDLVLRALCASQKEFALVAATHAFAMEAMDKSGSEDALTALQDLAGDPRHRVRAAVIQALRGILTVRGDATVALLASWMDGYLQAHVVLEAITDRALLSNLSAEREVLTRLDEAFLLADASPRAAERLQGVRLLREALPTQIAKIAARFPAALEWLQVQACAIRPETRAVVARSIDALRKDSFSKAVLAQLIAALAATKPPPRDPSRIVHGTRKRGKRGK